MPVQFSVSVRGADLVRKGLENLRAQIPKIGNQRMFEAMERARKTVTRYPSARGNYARTGTYGRAWRVVRKGSGLEGYTLKGEARGRRGRDYTKFVGGDAYGGGQARVHAGRWVKVRDAVEKETQRLPKTIQQHIDTVARRVK